MPAKIKYYFDAEDFPQCFADDGVDVEGLADDICSLQCDINLVPRKGEKVHIVVRGCWIEFVIKDVQYMLYDKRNTYSRPEFAGTAEVTVFLDFSSLMDGKLPML